MVATTLTVVSCLHRHASLDSMREVETVQPLAPLPIFGKTTNTTRFSTAGQGRSIPTGRWSDHEIDTPRSYTPNEITDAVADCRKLGVRGADQLMPLDRLPNSRITSRWASRFAMSCRLSCACLPRANASSTLTFPSKKYSDNGTSARLPSLILPMSTSIWCLWRSSFRLRRGSWLVQLPW